MALTKTDGAGVASQWFTYKLTQASVTSFSLDTDATGNLIENVSISPATIEWDYVLPDGTTQSAVFDLLSGA